MGHGSGVIPDAAAPDREREGSPVRQIARPVGDPDRGYVASITAGRQAKDAYRDLVLMNDDPDRSDEQIDELVENAGRARRTGTLRGASEGMVLEV